MRKAVNIFLFLVLYVSLAFAVDVEYNFGRGLKIGKFTLGGYSAFIYKNNTDKNYRRFSWNELALLGFIDITDRFKFFAELELKDIYIKSSDSSEDKNLNTDKIEINRIYIDYSHSDYFKIRTGRFITPLGYWNPVYVIVLKWTTSDPITSIQFYPRFLTGVRFFGYLPFQNDTWEYDFVAQAGKQINEDNNSIIAKNFYAFQIKKYFWENSAFGINGGSYEKKNIPEKVKFIGFNVDIKKSFYEITYEYFYSREKEPYYPKKYSKISYYLQGVLRVVPKNYLIGRIEYFKDLSDGKHIENYIIGWNFRPLYPVSIKAEYKLRNDMLNDKNNYEHIILGSLSVLF